ncbi:Uma2 family endonuclease [Xanthobacter sediminis]
MASSARIASRMTIAEFLALKGEEGVRYELVEGVPVRAMTGASRRHDRIVVNAIAALRQTLKGKPCEPSTADIAIVVPNGNVRRPDAMVACGATDDRAQVASDPRLVIEVLSASTRGIDLLRKLEEYKSVPGLAYILIVEPEAPCALLWRREAGPDAPWTLEELSGRDGRFDLPAIGAALAMADLYDRLAFDASGEALAPAAPAG